ncbi:hypothetical protein NDU88_000425 [Pleurodeles waltl]|uniref:Uncharacterized protein n=1 Tax=Pleurodeles waltl TaxID=8319 RepID=A0AAV7KMV2_PLEWA|nr:hypothetical protein NDU88_000425 [Pleurodeles waltl]
MRRDPNILCPMRPKIERCKEYGASSSAQDIELGEEEQKSIVPLDEYVLDLEQGDFDVDDLFTEDKAPTTSKGIVKDPMGEEMFSPHNIRHPRSAEWWPLNHAGQFIKQWMRNPLEKESRHIPKAKY